MQGDLIPKLVYSSPLNKLWRADRQQSEQTPSFMSASSLAGRASANRPMIISDFVMEVARGSLFSNCTLSLVGSQTSKSRLCSFAAANHVALLLSPAWRNITASVRELEAQGLRFSLLLNPDSMKVNTKRYKRHQTHLISNQFLAISTTNMVLVLVYSLQVSVNFGNFSRAQEAIISGIQLFFPPNLFEKSPPSAKF